MESVFRVNRNRIIVALILADAVLWYATVAFYLTRWEDIFR